MYGQNKYLKMKFLLPLFCFLVAITIVAAEPEENAPTVIEEERARASCIKASKDCKKGNHCSCCKGLMCRCANLTSNNCQCKEFSLIKNRNWCTSVWANL